MRRYLFLSTLFLLIFVILGCELGNREVEGTAVKMENKNDVKDAQVSNGQSGNQEIPSTYTIEGLVDYSMYAIIGKVKAITKDEYKSEWNRPDGKWIIYSDGVEFAVEEIFSIYDVEQPSKAKLVPEHCEYYDTNGNLMDNVTNSLCVSKKDYNTLKIGEYVVAFMDYGSIPPYLYMKLPIDPVTNEVDLSILSDEPVKKISKSEAIQRIRIATEKKVGK